MAPASPKARPVAILSGQIYLILSGYAALNGMIKRVAFILIWTAGFFFVPPMILGFISGLFHLPDMAVTYMYAFLVLGVTGFVLSLRGKLPGTKGA